MAFFLQNCVVLYHFSFGINNPVGFAGEEALDDKMVTVRVSCGNNADLVHNLCQYPLEERMRGQRPDRNFSQLVDMKRHQYRLETGEMVDNKNNGAGRNIIRTMEDNFRCGKLGKKSNSLACGQIG